MKHIHADFSILTPAQMKVARLVIAGLTNQEIAERLKLSPRTVDHHRSAALQRMDCHNAVQLTLKAFCAGILKPCK